MMNLPLISPQDKARTVVTECGHGTCTGESNKIDIQLPALFIQENEDADDTALDLLLRDDSTKSSTPSANMTTNASRSSSERNLFRGQHSSRPPAMTTLRRVVSEDYSPSNNNNKENLDPLALLPIATNVTSNTTQIISPVSTASPSKKVQQHDNCTTALVSLILGKQYHEANRRVREHPEEASIWVTTDKDDYHHVEGWKASKLIAPSRSFASSSMAVVNHVPTTSSTTNKKTSLPIHVACANLATASESMERFQLEQLILKLVLTFPDGCSMMDRSNGQSPLLLAIWNNATPETISMLLMADPSSIYHRDPCGRTAAEVNRHRCGIFVEQVKDLLAMGVDFWKEARHKAADKFHQSLNFTATTVSEQPSVTSAVTDYPDSSLTVDDDEDDDANNEADNNDAAESLMSETFPSLLQRQERLASIFRGPQQENLHRSYEMPSRNSNMRSLLTTACHSNSTKELESKTSILQDMLSEMHEKNQRLSTTINELSQINSDLHKKLEGNNNINNKTINTNSDSESLLRQVEYLQKERDELMQKIVQQQQQGNSATTMPFETIREVPTSEEEADRPFDEKAQDSSVCAARPTASRHDVLALRAQNKAMKQKIARLKTKKNRQSEKIEYLKSIVACTREDVVMDLSTEAESASTFSILDSITTNPTYHDADKADDDDHSSTASSFRRRLATSAEKAAETTKESLEKECLITGLASYRFREFVSRLQKRFCPPKHKKKVQEPTTEMTDVTPIETDDVDKICGIAAELYYHHVQEHPWRHGGLILQWEPPAVIRAAPVTIDEPVDRNLSKSQPPKQQLGAVDIHDREVPMVIPVRYRVAEINNELGSIISYSETSLSSIGMNSLSDNLWI